MNSIIQDIQSIRSLRKNIREQPIPPHIITSIETIHNCINNGSNTAGGKKFDWRDKNNDSYKNSYSTKNVGASYASATSTTSATYKFNKGSEKNKVTEGNSNRHSESRHSGGKQSEYSNTKHYETKPHNANGNANEEDGWTNVANNKGKSRNNNDFFKNRHNDLNDEYQAKSSFASSYNKSAPYSCNESNNCNTSNYQNSIPLTAIIAVDSVVKPAVTNTTFANSTTDTFRPISTKYVSRFKKASENIEDTILNTILLGKLNKFSNQNYEEIKEFVTHIIDGGQTDMIKCFMKLVFEKAASEEMFCPLYAKLLSELSAEYPILLTEMAKLYSEYMEIFEEVSDTTAENYNEVCKRNIEKKYRRGYSQFLAELIKYNIIDTPTFIKTIDKIITRLENNMKNIDKVRLNEEYADCLMKMIEAIDINKSDDDEDDKDEFNIKSIRQVLYRDIIHFIQPFTYRDTENNGISTKARFAILGICETIAKFRL